MFRRIVNQFCFYGAHRTPLTSHVATVTANDIHSAVTVNSRLGLSKDQNPFQGFGGAWWQRQGNVSCRVLLPCAIYRDKSAASGFTKKYLGSQHRRRQNIEPEKPSRLLICLRPAQKFTTVIRTSHARASSRPRARACARPSVCPHANQLCNPVIRK